MRITEKAVIQTNAECEPLVCMKSFGKRISPTVTLKALEIGQSFVIDNHNLRSSITGLSSKLGIKVSTVKMDGGRLFVKRTS